MAGYIEPPLNQNADKLVVIVERQKNKNMTTKEKDEALRSVLRRVQRMWIEKKGLTIFLVSDDADWLVIMQCLQDHGLFASGKKRPPLKAFVKWVQENQIAQLLTICDDYYLSMASRKLHGARYPWDNVEWNPHVLVRWRKLYKILDQKLTELTM